MTIVGYIAELVRLRLHPAILQLDLVAGPATIYGASSKLSWPIHLTSIARSSASQKQSNHQGTKNTKRNQFCNRRPQRKQRRTEKKCGRDFLCYLCFLLLNTRIFVSFVTLWFNTLRLIN